MDQEAAPTKQVEASPRMLGLIEKGTSFSLGTLFGGPSFPSIAFLITGTSAQNLTTSRGSSGPLFDFIIWILGTF